MWHLSGRRHGHDAFGCTCVQISGELLLENPGCPGRPALRVSTCRRTQEDAVEMCMPEVVGITEHEPVLGRPCVTLWRNPRAGGVVQILL